MDTRNNITTTTPSSDLYSGSFGFAIDQLIKFKPNNESTIGDIDEYVKWLCYASTRTENMMERLDVLDHYFTQLKVISFSDLNERFFFDAPERAPHFVDALIRNKTIKAIYFGSDFQREAISVYMEKYLKETTSLTTLKLQAVDTFDTYYDKRKLLDKDILHIANALKFNTSLEVLDLSYQKKLTDTGFGYIIDAINMNPSCKLREIKIGGIPLSKEIKNELQATLAPNVSRHAYREVLLRQQRLAAQTETQTTNINMNTPKPF